MMAPTTAVCEMPRGRRFDENTVQFCKIPDQLFIFRQILRNRSSSNFLRLNKLGNNNVRPGSLQKKQSD